MICKIKSAVYVCVCVCVYIDLRHQLLRGLQILSLAGRAERPVICCSAVFRSCPSRVERSGSALAAPRSSDPVLRGSSGAAGISCSAVFRSRPSLVERSGRHQLLRGLQILSLAGRAERQASAAPRSSDPVPRWSSGAAGYQLLRGLQILSLAGRAERPVICCSAVFRSCPSRVERSGSALAAPWSSDPVPRGSSGAAGISCSAVFRSCLSRVERSGRHQLLRGLQILSLAG